MTGKEEEVRRGPPSQGKEIPSGEGGRPAELSPGPPPNPGFPGREIRTVRQHCFSLAVGKGRSESGSSVRWELAGKDAETVSCQGSPVLWTAAPQSHLLM